jgi:DNA-binding NtrC family response regulator/cytochrome b subunit of formate dehydrogenase
MAGERVLILEDDPLLQSVLAERLRQEGLEVQTASTIAEARRALEQGEPDVALCDLRLPDGESLELVREAAPRGAAVFVVMTAHATVASAVEALKLGARDYLEKPFSLDRAVATVRQALEVTALRREVAALRDRSSHAGTTVIAESAPMKRVFELVERLAAVDATTVLIEGESGTGKGAIAQALHRMSRRSVGPFLNVTCSALPETLMESELFGHEKGAFTDAHAAKRGLVEMADGGTLFLDEIGELTPGVQAKLLRFIEEKTFRRLGGTRDLTVDVRIMTATNRDLAGEVAAGRFRADLYYRLRVIPITLPPLRERPDDIGPLAKHFVAHFAREFAKRIGEITPDALGLLVAYPWPGNVRELRNVMERAVLLADGSAIGVPELPPEVAQPGLAAGAAAAAAGPADGGGGTLSEVERRLLVTALEKAHGNQSRAATVLGISRHQIRTRMRRYGLLGLVLAASALWAGPLRAQRQGTAEERQASASCLLCHGDHEVLRRSAPQGWNADSLFVTPQSLAAGPHRDVPCVRCHPNPGVAAHPLGGARATVPCGTCHPQADSLWRAGPHGGRHGKPEAACTACHGRHGILPAAALQSGDGLRHLTERCVTCHPERAFKPGDVHRGKVNCASCHGSHMIQPVRDPATRGVPVGIAERCGACHQAEAAAWRSDWHGTTAARQARGAPLVRGHAAATCVDCHGGHGIEPARALDREVGLIEKCAACHPEEGESYRDTYHGRANRLGYYRAARCADCHTAHQVYPPSDPRSTVAPARRVATCARCHAKAARPNFVAYRPHARPSHPSEGPAIYGAWLLMNVLLFSVFTVFGLHTFFWLMRLLQLKWAERQRRIALGLPPKARTHTPLDSADRGEGPYVWRFRLTHRVLHGISVVSFFTLIITGLPLRFSCAVWASQLMALIGGTRTAGIIHRTAGGITVAYFAAHLVDLVVSFVRSKDRKGMLWGPDSMVPGPQDVRDFLQMFKWFFGKAPYPRFPRYGYNEKFHYFGAFWGIILLGASGLMRWFPGFFTLVLPGWTFNVAAIFHSEEAVLAAGFMFVIHFFNVHMRPDKFPVDGTMFTGRARLEVLREEHPRITELWGDLSQAPASARAIPDRVAPPPPRWMTLTAAVFGLGALGVGLVLVGMILWVQLC